MVAWKFQSETQRPVQQRFQFERASRVQSLYVQARQVQPLPSPLKLLFVFVGQRQIERPFVAVFDVNAARRLQLAREIGVNRKAGRGEIEELVLALSLYQRGEHAGGGMRSFAPDAPPFDDDDAHPGLPQPPRYGATDYARADDDGVSLFDRLGHLGWIRRSFFLSGLSAPLFSHAARVFKTTVGRVDLVIDHRIYRALDPFEDALLEIGQIIGRFFGQARPERVGQIIERITHGFLFFRHMLIPRHEWDL